MAFRATLLRSLNRSDMLVWWTLLGVSVGVGVGALLYKAECSNLVIELIGYPGELYLRAIQLLVLPLVVSSLMTGVFSLRKAGEGLGRIARWSLLYYIISMLLAVFVGMALFYIIKPGKTHPFVSSSLTGCSNPDLNSPSFLADGEQDSSGVTAAAEAFLNIGRKLIPTNVVAAAAEPNYLGIVTFAIVFAFFTNAIGERADPFMNIIEICNSVVVKIVLGVIAFTPFGVASLTAKTLLKACNVFHLLKALGVYMGTVLGGFFIHSMIVLPFTVVLLSQKNPFKLLRDFSPALFLGLGTSSSAATMPLLTMKCAEDSGCDPSLVRFVVPLGTSINRDGSALYEAISVLFICQAHGLELKLSKLFVLAIASTLAAIGCASVPQAGVVSVITALQAVGLSRYVGDVSILLAVDWLLGSIRTSVNIWGDGCACLIVNEWTKRSQLLQKTILPTSADETITEPLLPKDSGDSC